MNATTWNEPYPDMAMNELVAEAKRLHCLHQLPDTLDAWTAHRERLVEAIWQRIGARPDHGLDLDVQTLGTTECEGYRIDRLIYQSRPGFYVTANLYLPEGDGPFPGVIGVHGHAKEGHLSGGVQAANHILARNGYVCLLIDAFGSGERSTVHCEYEYHGANLGASLMDVGETLMGMQVADNMRGVDLLQSLPFVIRDRIGVTGASGGGNQTMWLAALDERIAAAVPVVSVGTFESYIGSTNCICEVLPDGLTFTEESGILALTAPRALKILNALFDRNQAFFPAEMLRSFNAARGVYELYDADEALANQVFNTPHGYKTPMHEAMLGWFDRWLKSEGAGAPKRVPQVPSLPEKDLLCFEKGKRPEQVVSIAEFCRTRAAKLKQERESAPADPAKNRDNLRTLLRLRAPAPLRALHRHGTAEGLGRRWQRITLELADNELIPLLLLEPSGKASSCTAFLHPFGKDCLFESPALAEAIERGEGIALFDLWGSGERGACELKLDPFHDLARACLWLGRTLVGEWTRTILATAEALRTECGLPLSGIHAERDAALPALAYRALCGEKTDLVLHEAPRSFAFGDGPCGFTMACHIPGFLRWGNIDLLESLGTGAVRFTSPRKMCGSPT